MTVMLRYLAGSSASILDNTIVEKEQLASGVYYSLEYRPSMVIQFAISGVATPELENVEKRFFEVLREAASQPLDMSFLKDCIVAERREVKFQAESSAQFFTDPIIRDFLFGNRDGSTLRGDLQDLKEYDTLDGWSNGQWKHCMSSWLLESNHITVLGSHPPDFQRGSRWKRKSELRAERRSWGNKD